MHQDRGDPLRFESHRVAAIGRELILGDQLANPHEHQAPLFVADELHPAKPDAGMTGSVIGVDDLIGRQRHSETVGKNHERTGWAVADDRQLRDPIRLGEDRRRRRKGDEQWR